MITFKNQDEELEKQLNKSLDDIIEAKLLSNSINEIVITNTIRETIKEYCRKYEVPELNISKGREYTVVSKIVDFKNGIKIFFDYNTFYSIKGFQIFYETIISVAADDVIGEHYPLSNTFKIDGNLDDVLKTLIGYWTCKEYSTRLINKLFQDREPSFKTAKSFVNTFKRSIKRIHFEFQSSLDITEFWIRLVRELDYLIRRCIEVKNDNNSLKEGAEFETSIQIILSEIEIITDNIISQKEFNLFKIKKEIRNIFRLCHIEIPLYGQMKVEVKKSPVNLFKDLIDTETRIVAFLDILGFSAIIEEYDNNETSNILNDLHDALEVSIKTSIESMINPQIKSDLSENLEYKMFSDCISLSLPFIEFKNDFNLQFNSICTIIKSYQMMMMQKGFYIRGGVSIGSYYSNKNMIFSGGLVKAYKIETKAKYPIVVVDEEIIGRIKKNNAEIIPGIRIEDSLLYDVTIPDKVFINPFEPIENTKKNFGYLEKSIEELKSYSSKNTDDPLDKLSNSLVSLISSFTKPVISQAKNLMTDELMVEAKKDILDKLKNNILELALKLQEKSNKDETKTKEIEKVIDKLKYLEELILWSIDKNNSTKFNYFENQTE